MWSSRKIAGNDQVILEVVAADGIGRKDIVPIYNAVYKMCQFLTFRKNVQFSKVELLVEECWDGEVFPITGGTVFSRDHFEKAIEKNWNRCISFETMKECMGTLFKMIYVEKVNKPYFSLNFLPENDADENWISVEKSEIFVRRSSVRLCFKSYRQRTTLTSKT